MPLEKEREYDQRYDVSAVCRNIPDKKSKYSSGHLSMDGLSSCGFYLKQLSKGWWQRCSVRVLLLCQVLETLAFVGHRCYVFSSQDEQTSSRWWQLAGGQGHTRFLAPMPASCILLLARKLGWPWLGRAKPCKTDQIQNESPQDKGTMQEGNCWRELATD